MGEAVKDNAVLIHEPVTARVIPRGKHLVNERIVVIGCFFLQIIMRERDGHTFL